MSKRVQSYDAPGITVTFAAQVARCPSGALQFQVTPKPPEDEP